MADLNRIKEKIRALKALANDSAATQGEINAALDRAQKLAHQYMLDLSEIEDENLIKDEFLIDKLQRDLLDHKIRIAVAMDNAIARLFDCEIIYNTFLKRQWICGTEQDRTLASYCIDFAHSSLHARWDAYKRSLEYAQMKVIYTSKQIKKDFISGFCVGVVEKCQILQSSKEDVKVKATGTSLVLVKSDLIQKYKDSAFPNLKSTTQRAHRIRSDKIVNSGLEKGKAIEFSRPISSGEKSCNMLQS